MRRLVVKKTTQHDMDQSDIRDIVNLLKDAILEKNWDTVYEAKEYLVEFLDNEESDDDE